MKKTAILAVVLAFGAAGAFYLSQKRAEAAELTSPAWLETDFATAIENRIKGDFSLTLEEAVAQIKEKHPEVTQADIDTFIARHYIETRDIDGRTMVYRKSIRNLDILNPAYNGGREGRELVHSEKRLAFVDSVLDYYQGKNDMGLGHRVTFRFTVDIPYDVAIADDTLRVWMPVPLSGDRCDRQDKVVITATEPAEYILSGDKSIHNTIYFEAPSPKEGETAHFEYVGRYDTFGSFLPYSTIREYIKPYDRNSDLYRQYTAFEAPHIVNLEAVAKSIVGDETDPLRQSELVYDYITRFPWAGAREYSTIDCIPQYVLDVKHGDCGQVALLYISLIRSLGIPARWESGWMIHPGEKNYHDWAEVYFEGVGWVPVDASFSRYSNATTEDARNFYSHGMDAHRFATNKGIGGKLWPEKRYIRSETVDFQAGEVETSRGNLFYPAWESGLEIISVEPIEAPKK